MSHRWALIVGVFLVAVCGSVQAEFFSGNDLKARLEDWELTNSSDYRGASLGAGYVVGVHDALSAIAVCSPTQVTVGQITAVTLKFMRANPEVLNLTADRVIAKSLRGTWPCSSNSSATEFFSGNNLKARLEQWDQHSDTVEAWMGVGYVAGVHDAYDHITVCTSSEVTIGQLASVTLKFMRQNPEQLEYTASTEVSKSLILVWPCKPRNEAAETGDTSSSAHQSVRPTSKPKPKSKPKSDTDSPF